MYLHRESTYLRVNNARLIMCLWPKIVQISQTSLLSKTGFPEQKEEFINRAKVLFLYGQIMAVKVL